MEKNEAYIAAIRQAPLTKFEADVFEQLEDDCLGFFGPWKFFFPKEMSDSSAFMEKLAGEYAAGRSLLPIASHSGTEELVWLDLETHKIASMVLDGEGDFTIYDRDYDFRSWFLSLTSSYLFWLGY